LNGRHNEEKDDEQQQLDDQTANNSMLVSEAGNRADLTDRRRFTDNKEVEMAGVVVDASSRNVRQ